MEQLCPYQILGVSPDATSEAICSAWRHLSLECHPDKRPGDPTASAKFAALTHAKDCLLNPDWHRASDTNRRCKRRRRHDEAGWGDIDGQAGKTPKYDHHAPSDAVKEARRAAAAANKKALEMLTVVTSSSEVASSQWRQVREDKLKTFPGRKLAKDDVGEVKRRPLSKACHPERLVSFNASFDEESESSIGDESCSSESCAALEAQGDVTAIDEVFSHACGSWQADILSGGSEASHRFLFLMPASLLQLFRPQQRNSVLFAYDYRSKVLYEYLPDSNTCAVLWSPTEPAINAAIWTILPLPPAWLRDTSGCQEQAPGRYSFTLPAGCLSCFRPGHRESVRFSYDPKSKVLSEFVADTGNFRVLWTPTEPSENVLIWTVLPLPPELPAEER